MEDESAAARKRRRGQLDVRLTRLHDDHDAIDRAYFAALPTSRKMELVGEMFVEQWLQGGGDEEQLRLRRSVARLQRRSG